MRFSVLCLFLVACLLSVNTYAIKVSDLYRVSVAVDDQTTASRTQGVQWAFQQLIVKVSGDDIVLENPTLVAASNDAERYLRGFSYETDVVDGQVYLQAWFSKALVVPLLKRAAAPIWGENRPLLLNWLAIEPPSDDGSVVVNSGADSRVLVSSSLPQWQGRFNRVFAERGLPVLWPTADLEDSTALTIEQLWWLIPESIKQASERYQADAVLAGRLNQSAEGVWQYQGVFFNADESLPLLASGETPQAAMTLVAAELSKFFSDHFAIKPSSIDHRQGIRVVISQVKDFTDYSRVLAYLKSITGVRNVEVAQVDRDNLELYLSLEGDWDKVQRIIRLDKKLISLQEKEFEWAQ